MEAFPSVCRSITHYPVAGRLVKWLGIALLALWMPQLTHAQGLSGITGTITDQTGAVVPDAKVTVTNNATNVVHTAVTTSQGAYFITDVNPGTYTVKVEKAGFETAVVQNVNVFV